MEEQTLSDSYTKAKRYLTAFSGVLVLSAVVGLSPASQNNMLGWSIDSPDLVASILYFVVVYYFIQLVLFWDAQGSPIRSLPQNKFDYLLSVSIGLTSLYTLPIGELLSSFFWNERNRLLPWWWIVLLFVIPIMGILLHKIVYKPWAGLVRKQKAEARLDVLELIVSNVWKLVFNVKAYKTSEGIRGFKEVIFDIDGNISKGNNQNENKWRVSQEYLEILDSSGEVFSRFKYDDKTELFLHTNDADTRSLPHQYLEVLRSIEQESKYR